MWRWFAGLKVGVAPPARVECWPRGGAKSTTVELAVSWLAKKLTRTFVLYVCATQDQADRHVGAISTFMVADGVQRSISQYGHSRGWKANRLRTSGGFNVEALGLDTAARGIKLDDIRPNLIIFDDIDSELDTPKATEKKITLIANKIIPAGSEDCAILFVQNLIIEDGIMAKLISKDDAPFLYDRDVPEPDKAIDGLEYEPFLHPETGRTLYRITAGVPTWEGQGIAECERRINKGEGLAAFLRESQHEVESADGYFFDSEAVRYVDALPDDLAKFKFCRAWDLAATQGGGDYTSGNLHAWSPAKVEYVVDVKRDQLSSDNVRKLMLATAREDAAKYGTVTYRIPNDPGQAGNYQSEQLAAMLREVPGIRVVIVAPSGRKGVRSRGYADHWNNGNVILVRGEWNHVHVQEHRKFREDEQHEHDDQVDAGADAHNELDDYKPGWSKALAMMSD